MTTRPSGGETRPAGNAGAPRRASGTLIELLRKWTHSQPRKPAYTFLRDGEEIVDRLTYEELERRIRVVAAQLAESTAVGDRVLLALPPGLDFVAAFLGCLYGARIAVPVYPPRLTRRGSGQGLDKLRAVLGDARPTLALAGSALVSRMSAQPELAALPWSSLAPPDHLEPEVKPANVKPSTVAFLQYTSGSTGEPKGVMVSHGNLLHNAAAMQERLRYSGDSVFVSWLPLYHDMGLIGVVLESLYLGASCILMSPMAFLQRPRRWLAAISSFRATVSGGPNFAYELCLRKIPPPERRDLDLSSWSVAFNGAEPVRGDTVERFAEAFVPHGFDRRAMCPSYGLAEATLLVAGASPRRPPTLRRFPAKSTLVGCGLSLRDQQILVVNPKTHEPCAPGRVGEVWVRGPSIAQGYWRRPTETRKVFRAELAAGSADEPGETAYFLRTGDLGILEHGELFLTGRLKELILLRGRNFYPQDIELTAARSHPELETGSAAAFSIDVEGEARLVLLQEVGRQRQAPLEEIADAIRQAVTAEHEVAVHDVVLLRQGTLAKTTSGKIRRRHCRDLYLAGDLQPAGPWRGAEVPPPQRSADDEVRRPSLSALTGAALRARLQAHLGREIVRRTGRPASTALASSMGVYLDSLAAVELGHELERELGVVLSPARLLAARDLGELTELALRALETGTVPPGQEEAVVVSGPPAGPHPLSVGQQALFFVDRLAPESAAYNVVISARLRGEPDPAALRDAFRTLVERHASLRTGFLVVDGEVRQRVHDSRELDFLHRDVPEWDEERVGRQVSREAWRPFDLEHDSLLRVRIWRRLEAGDGSGVGGILLLVVHHLVTDFWSLSILMEELAVLYARRRGIAAGALPEPPAARYQDYVRWQKTRLAGARGEALWRYWQERLGEAPPPMELPCDRPRPGVRTFRGASRVLRSDTAAAIRSLGQQAGATPFMTLLTLFEVLLHRLTGQDEIRVGSPSDGRLRPELSRLTGYFVQPVVLRPALAGDPSFAALLRHTRQDVIGALEHREYPFPLLAQRLGGARDPSRSPVFEVLFVLETPPPGSTPELAGFALGEEGGRFAMGDLVLESLALRERRAAFDLTLMIAIGEHRPPGGIKGGKDSPPGGIKGGKDRLTAVLEYNSDLFDATTAQRILARFGVLLGAVLADPTPRISELALLAPAEHAQVLLEWNDTGRRAAAGCLHELFADQVARSPHAVALVFAEHRLSYRQLDVRADRLARRLRRQGVGPEVRVGVLAERTAQLPVLLLGILKAGGAYVPLDPAYPRERLDFMRRDAGLRTVLTREDAAENEDDAAAAVALAEVAVAPQNLAYLIYTSGSTGRPKAVAIEHRSVVGRMYWAREAFAPRELAGVLATTSICFDLSVFELFAPLCWGGTVILAENLLALPVLAAAAEVTLINTVPSLLGELLRDYDPPPSVLAVNLAGEPFRGGLLRRLGKKMPGARIRNLYGPSEDTTYSTSATPGATGAAAVPIGRPLAGTRVFLTDRQVRPVSSGRPAELCLAGGGLARGYLGRPAQTAARFVPDPFAAPPGGARLYRTGDQARHLGDGRLDFLGRIDFQVKLRGFRIEPGEIEAALEVHPAVREAVVVLRDEPQEPRLVAYLLSGDGEEPLFEDVRRFLGEKLPRSWIPAAFVVLQSLPRTPNGKIDRRALPSPAPGRPARAAGDDPGTPLEEVVAAIWCEVLGRERVGVRDNFFELGGHSLLGIRVIARLRDAVDVELPLARLFERPRLAELAAELEALRGTARPRRPPPGPLTAGAARVLSPAQERLWFLDQLAGSSPHYNMPGSVDIAEDLDVAAFEAALREIVQRHQVLRCSFRIGPEGPVPELTPAPARFPLPRVDLAFLPPAVAAGQARRLAVEEARRPFDLSRPDGLWLRVLLLHLAERRHQAVVTMHHIASDGPSQDLFYRELGTLYSARRTGRRPRLPDLPLQYTDLAAWQRQVSSTAEDDLAYWRRRLAAFPDRAALPTDRPRPPVQSVRGAVRRLEFSAALTAALHRLARRQGCSLFMTLLAVFELLLARYSAQSDLAVGTPVSARDETGTESLLGLFMNMLVLRTELAGVAQPVTWNELLRRTRETVLEAHRHRFLPFERLVEELGGERDLSRTPLFQVMMTLGEAPLGDGGTSLRGDRGGTSTFRPRRIRNGTAKYDWTLELIDAGAGLGVELEYCVELFDAVTIDRALRHLRLLSGAAVTDPGARLAAVTLWSVAQRHQLLHEWNDTADAMARAPGVCVHHLVAARAEERAARIAVSTAGESWSYRELTRRAAAVARGLGAHGVRPGVRVALCVERSLAMVAGLLGILEAGGAYVPLDPTHPAERLAFILEDARVTCLVTSKHLRGRLLPESRLAVLDLDELCRTVDEGAGISPPHLVAEHDLAYVIYTSGSTGRPKGVEIRHAGVVSFLCAMQRRLRITAGDTLLAVTTVSFDIAVLELLLPLMAGGRVVLAASDEAADGQRLAARLADESVRLAQATPATWRLLLDGGWRGGPGFRVLCGGEALPGRLAAELTAGGAELWNLYGPTETTVWSAVCRVTGRTSPGGAVAIGPPIANTRLRVMERHLTPAPLGLPGELLIGGDGLARAYHARPALTAERFVPDPFGGPGERLYRTGDRVRFRSDATLEFLGRTDHQVKIRGFRIELGEIEAALDAHPEVAQAVVVAREDGSGGARLEAYTVAVADAGPGPDELRRFLRGSLPDFMVPSRWIRLDELPRTPNGKIDRRSLPSADPAVPTDEFVAPTTATETELAEIFESLLGTGKIGIHDNFFTRGGHSLLAGQVLARVAARFAVRISLRDFFADPTVAGLTIGIAEQRAAALGDDELATLLATLEGLNDAQTRELLDEATPTE